MIRKGPRGASAAPGPLSLTAGSRLENSRIERQRQALGCGPIATDPDTPCIVYAAKSTEDRRGSIGDQRLRATDGFGGSAAPSVRRIRHISHALDALS